MTTAMEQQQPFFFGGGSGGGYAQHHQQPQQQQHDEGMMMVEEDTPRTPSPTASSSFGLGMYRSDGGAGPVPSSSSPFSSPMSATKRRNPFATEGSPVQLKTVRGGNWSMPDYYTRTYTDVLMTSQQQQQQQQQQHAMDMGYMCSACQRAMQCVGCAFCSRNVCGTCSRQCESCCEVFCARCSTINYDSNYDRVFCLTCNDAISRGLGSGSIFGTAHQHHQLPPAPARQHLLSSYFAPISVQSSSSSSSSSAAGASSSPIAFGRRSSTSGGTGRSSPPNAPRSSPPSSLW